MKKNETMKTIKENLTNTFSPFFFILPFLMFALFACDNPVEQPFRAGLGPVVDTQPPTVTLRDPHAGDFIWGQKNFSGSAHDDYRLDKVEMKVTNHKGLKDENVEDEWKNYRRVSLNLDRQNTGKWSQVFDTTIYRDGDLKIRLKVTDSTNKTTETEEISFYINNDRPAIMVTMPPVISIDDPDKIKPGMIGGQSRDGSLNYEVTATTIPYNPNRDPRENRPWGRDYPRVMEKGSTLSGTISDAQDIYINSDKTNGRYPPQIRVWRIRDEFEEPEFNPDDPAWLPGEFPTETQVPWHDLSMDNGELFPVGGIGKYQFNYALPDEPRDINRYYGFEVRAQNRDGRSSFRYPRDCYSDGPGTDWDDANHRLNRYVMIFLRPQREAPEVGIYSLENVIQYWKDGGTGAYQILKDGSGKELDEHRYHPYIDSLTTVNKNGDGFILRVKAKHSDDIGFAAVYWTKEGTNERGRFIWDPAEVSYPPNVPAVDPSNPYTEWGYRDPQLGIDGRTTRSFFFTYKNDPSGDSIPNDTKYHSDVRGKSKLQILKNPVSAEAWSEIRKGIPAADLWTDINKLDDGVYNLDIYVRSRSGTVPVTLNCSVRLDTTPPAAEVLDVEGNYMRIDSPSNVSYMINGKSHTKTRTVRSPVEYIVNGVVQPNLLFTDDGSGPRTASVKTATPSDNYFWNPSTGRNGYEQLYVLVKHSDRTALQTRINGTKNWWPVNDAVTALDTGTIPVLKDGRVPLDGGKFRFRLKTSYVNYPYDATSPPDDGDSLPDTSDTEPYWLYVFCRDNAFNVGYAFVMLDVKAETDLPEIDFSAGAIREVTNPNLSADGTNAGFYDNERNLRNKLTSGSPIRLFIKDDDSLDLGVDGGDPSEVKIRVAPARYDGNGIISAGTFVSLGDPQIKAIFPPQVLDAGVRRAVKSIQGGSAIPQQTLVSALGLGTGANLPDGMYNIEISVGDYNVDPVKMKMPTDPSSSPVRAVSPTKHFWVVVDNTPPEFKLDTSGSFQPEEYVDNGFIRGTVEDANGPVTMTTAVFDSSGNEVKSGITFNQTGNPGPNTGTANWEGRFEAAVAMNGYSGRYRFEITFQDRFQNRKTLSMWLSADNVPPRAVIGTEISTFKRDYDDADTGLNGVTSENRNRLANGVLNFTISASDFIDAAGTTPGKLKSVKWWLVSGNGSVAPDKDEYKNTTQSTTPYTNSVRHGVLTENFNAPQYIDTRTAPADNVYTLIVMAEDNAGNVSVPSSDSKQTIYLLQPHDKPYFGYSTTGNLPLTIKPANGEITKSSLVTGKIYDDDGFYDENNNLLSESVTIWMSTTDTRPDSSVSDSEPTSSNGYNEKVIITSGLSRAAKIDGNSVINLNLDLKTLFPGSMNADGSKQYIIGAQDSHLNKINPDGTKPAASERKTRYKRFSFIYDTKAPVIELINHPNNTVKTFGPNANNSLPAYDDVSFRLDGTITEANLKKNGAGNYYIEYYLDSNSQNPKPLELNGTGITVTPTADGIKFTVTADVFCNASNLNFINGVTNGSHSITFIAYDLSDQKGTYTFNFIKDMDPPTLVFTNPAVSESEVKDIRLPKVTFPVSGGTPQEWWWTPGGAPDAWYQARHNALETKENAKPLPVITYARGSSTMPQLKVTFTDSTSNINAASLNYWIDNETTARVAPPGINSRSVSWTIELVTRDATPAALSDGVHSIRFEIEDVVGNKLLSTETNPNGNIYYGFRINSGPPAITADPPSRKVYGNITGEFFNVPKITATGPNLKDVQLVIRYLGNNTSTTPAYLTAANGGIWSADVVITNGIATTNDEILTWNAYSILRTALPANATNGEYQLELRARGRDNQLSDPYIWNFTVDRLSAVPSITDFPTNAVQTGDLRPNYWNPTAANRKVFTSATQRIQGLISDEHSNLKTAEILIQRFDYSKNAWGDYYTPTGDSWFTTPTTGTWAPSATPVWSDLLGTDTTKEKTVSLQLGNIQGLTNGFFRIRLRATDSAYLNGGTGDGNPVTSSYYYFFYAPDDPSIIFEDDANPITIYSARAEGGSLKFKGIAKSAGGVNTTNGNGYQSLGVQVKRNGANYGNAITPLTWTPVPTAGQAATWNGDWNWEITVTSLTGSSDDDSYQLTFTVTDWAGNSSSNSRTITLDNTPPGGSFTAPELMPEQVRNSNARYVLGSETFYGGEASVIEGIADDSKGLAGIWYHLGYVASAALTTDVALPTRQDVIRTVLPTATNDLGGKANNDLFDAAAKNTNASSSRAWFKYTDDASYPRPDGFDAPATPLNLYTWKLSIPQSGDLSKNYAGEITLKNRPYNQATGQTLRLAQKLMETSGPNPLPAAYQKNNGLYCMPVWVRVSDEAGNVTYFNQNIWLYPKGDYPTIAIENPTERTGAKAGTENASRGGTILFDGIASDNVNVKSVIYRIRADNRRQGTAGWDTAAPTNQNNYIIPSGAAMLKSGDPEWAVFTATGPGDQGLTGVNTTGWFRASLEGADSPAKGKSWSFYVNSNDEFTTEWSMPDGTRVNPIKNWGFKTSTSLPDNDMIRVYVEILAFDGSGPTSQDYHLMSLGDNTADEKAKPDVVIFYLSSTSPRISDLKLSEVGSIGRGATALGTPNYETYTGLRTRSGKFAVQMKFESGSTQKPIGQVQVRLPNEAVGGNSVYSDWRTVWDKGTQGSAADRRGITFSNPANPTSTATTFNMTFAFNTVTDNDPNPFLPVMQRSWTASGGRYTIEVRLYDTNEPPRVTSQRFEIGIDNFAPVEDRKVITNPKVAGSSQTFMGRAFDYTQAATGNPQPGYYGIDRVYAWFTKNQNGTNQYVNMDTGAFNVTPTTANIQAYANRSATFAYQDGGETVTGITLNNAGNGPAARTYPAPTNEKSNNYVKVISEAEANNLANNMYWSDIIAGRSVQWSFILDTLKLPDGPIYLNYIVVDKAGNASLFQQSLVVMNNYPEINGITLYTDNTGLGAAFTKDASESYLVPASMPDGYLNSGFIAKNKYIGFRVETSKGNDAMHYRVQYVTRERVELTYANLTAIAADAAKTSGRDWSNIYTIAEKGGMDDNQWAKLMDRPKVTAVNGTHFAFLADPTSISAGMSYPGTYVYRYTVVSGLTRDVTKSGTNTPPNETLPNRSFVDDQTDTFRFQGDNDFGTGKITDKMGSQPDGDTTNPNDSDTEKRSNTALFLIKVYDTVNTNAGATEDDQLYAALVVGMNVYLTDSKAPFARLYDLNPYTETAVYGNNVGAANKAETIRRAAEPQAIGSNIVRGGLFNINTVRELRKSGYIEPHVNSSALNPQNSVFVNGTTPSHSATGGLPDSGYPLLVDGDQVTGGQTNDKVSGRIILRGVAWDDQLIKEISIKIGADEWKPIIRLVGKSMAVENNAPAYVCETLHWKTGHTVEWAYVWDTETDGNANGGPLSNVVVQVKVIDNNGDNQNTAVTSSSDSRHSQITVDIVPYITGFQRDKSKFETKRSLQGWYSFYQDEPNIALLGYNFGKNAADVKVNLLSANSGTGTDINTTLKGADAYIDRSYFSFAIPPTATSGRLNVSVAGANSATAWNHSSIHSNKSWNREYSSYTDGSDLWINKPYAHIWRTSDSNTAPSTFMGSKTINDASGSEGLDHPGMALEYTGTNAGRLHGTWAVYGYANVYYGTNAGANNKLITGTSVNNGPTVPGDPYATPDISIVNGGSGTAANIGFSYQGDGSDALLIKAVVSNDTAIADPNAANVANTIQTATTGPTLRWQNIRISKAQVNSANSEANVGKIYMTAFDARNKSLWYGSRDTTGTAVNRTMFIDGGNANITAANGSQTAVGSAGHYSAVDYDDRGPIIAYYDQTNDTVRVALGPVTDMQVNPAAANRWSRLNLLPSGNPLFRGSGKFISIKVDKDYGIHLAFYNSVYNKVVYYYAKDRTYIGSNTAPNTSANVKVFTIDNGTTGGTWTDISVDDYGNPWIVYGDSSRTGTYDGVRMAYQSSANTGIQFTGALTCPVTEAVITGWEALTMPADYKVNNDRLNIEAWPPTARGGTVGTPSLGANMWNAAIGYASDMYRIGYFYYPRYKNYGSHTQDSP
jgi:hypothetical protein